MKNTYIAHKELDQNYDYCQAIDKLEADMRLIVNRQVSPEEAVEYIKALLPQRQSFDYLPDMLFYGQDHPKHMPSDCRVAYFFNPTYIATGLLAYGYLNFPQLRDIDEYESVLRQSLNGCMSRGFMGAGHNDIQGFLYTMEIFTECYVDIFVEGYPDFNPAFTKMFREKTAFLNDELLNGKVVDPWTGKTYFKEALTQSLKMEDNQKVFLFVYGTLKQGEIAHHLLEDAEFVGEAFLKDYEMLYLGRYPGVVPCKGKTVAGELYSVHRDKMSVIDAYEDEGRLYSRRSVMIDTDEEQNCLVQTYVFLG